MMEKFEMPEAEVIKFEKNEVEIFTLSIENGPEITDPGEIE